MELTAFAQGLNNIFFNFDYSILSMVHSWAVAAAGILTPFFTFISLLADNGILLILLSVVLMWFGQTRRLGVGMFGAIACGALLTSIILKDWVARPRPFMDQASVYYGWWQAVGAPVETSFSFPSGHVTAAMAAVLAIILYTDRKKSWAWALLFVLLVALSRNYLMVHYPSDVLFGILVGSLSAVIAYKITNLIYSWLIDHSDQPWAEFLLRYNVNVLFIKDEKAKRRLYHSSAQRSSAGLSQPPSR